MLSDVVTQETRHSFKGEKLDYVQVGAFLFQGRYQETLISFEKLDIINSYGGSDYALIHVQIAAQINCTECKISQSMNYNFTKT